MKNNSNSSIFVFPFQFIFLVFWTLFHYDRSLIYPKGLDDFFPAWLNHAMVSRENEQTQTPVASILNTKVPVDVSKLFFNALQFTPVSPSCHYYKASWGVLER